RGRRRRADGSDRSKRMCREQGDGDQAGTSRACLHERLTAGYQTRRASARHAAPCKRAAGGRRHGAARRSLLHLPAAAKFATGVGMSLLVAEGARFRYGLRTVLDGVDLAVAEGEMVGLIGPNGA